MTSENSENGAITLSRFYEFLSTRRTCDYI